MLASEQVAPNVVDVSPLLKLYLESAETLRHNCETLARSMTAKEEAGMNTGTPSSYEAAYVVWQKSVADLFHHVVETQVELCRFYENRWTQYREMPQALCSCRSAADVGTYQAHFVNQFLSDYTTEVKKLAQPFAELTTKWMTVH